MPDTAWLTDDGRIDGAKPERVVRTHCAELWFLGDRVFKRKRPVDLGFLDFTTAVSRRTACEREVALNRRLTPDVYLGVVDVHDAEGGVVDAAVAMRRLPDDRRLGTLAAAGWDMRSCVRAVARQVAAFHAAEPPARDGAAYAGAGVLRTNWADNLAVLRGHPTLVDAAQVDAIEGDVDRYLNGRGPLLRARIADGQVRDGHGDLTAADIFCLPDGPRVLDCLEFTDRYRIGDVLLDVAFLAMDLERLGRRDLADVLIDGYQQFAAAQHPASLGHHYVAYRASVRAKVACPAVQAGADATGEQPATLAALAHRHLHRGRVRLVLVGGLPGTGKSTLAAALSERHGLVLLRTDEVRKDLLGVAHDRPAAATAYRPAVTDATYAEVLRRAETLLGLGESVVVDASWSAARHRCGGRAVALRSASELLQVECTAPPSVARDRLARRRGDASDATPEVHDTMAERFAPWDDAVRLDTADDPAAVADAASAALHLPCQPEERWATPSR